MSKKLVMLQQQQMWMLWQLILKVEVWKPLFDKCYVVQRAKMLIEAMVLSAWFVECCETKSATKEVEWLKTRYLDGSTADPFFLFVFPAVSSSSANFGDGSDFGFGFIPITVLLKMIRSNPEQKPSASSPDDGSSCKTKQQQPPHSSSKEIQASKVSVMSELRSKFSGSGSTNASSQLKTAGGKDGNKITAALVPRAPTTAPPPPPTTAAAKPATKPPAPPPAVKTTAAATAAASAALEEAQREIQRLRTVNERLGGELKGRDQVPWLKCYFLLPPIGSYLRSALFHIKKLNRAQLFPSHYRLACSGAYFLPYFLPK